jgi:hypothetical protein
MQMKQTSRLLFPLLLVWWIAVGSAQQKDSIDYKLKFDELYTLYGYDNSFRFYFEAAEELAQRKQFKNAQSVLEDFFENDTLFPYISLLPAKKGAAADSPAVDRAVQSTQSSGAKPLVRFQYYNSFRSMESASPNFITDSLDTTGYIMYSLEDKVSMTWRDITRRITKLEPWVSASDTRIKLGNELATAFFKRRLFFTNKTEYQKHISDDDRDEFICNNEAWLEGKLSLENTTSHYLLHATANVDRYRKSDYFYRSYIEYKVKPEYMMESDDLNKSFTVGLEYGYKDYTSIDSTRDDKNWFGPSLQGTFWGSRLDVSFFAWYYWEYAPYWEQNASTYKPGEDQYGYGDAWISWEVTKKILVEFNLQYLRNYEYYAHYKFGIWDTLQISTEWYFVDSVAFLNHGISGKPQVSFKFSKALMLSASCQFDKQTAYCISPQYADLIYAQMPGEISESIAPAVKMQLDLKKASFELGYEFKIKDITKGFLDYENNKRSRESRPYTYIRIYPASWLRISSSIEYSIVKFNASDMRHESVYVSLSAGAEF